MADHVIWTLDESPGPIIATAIHAGHALRPGMAELMEINDSARLREEDPHTNEWTVIGDARVVATQSRFQVDLNRPRDQAIYLRPEDAWGLSVWKTQPPPRVIEISLAEYDAFYSMLNQLVEDRIARYRRVVVLDIHSYNHRRGGPMGAPADPGQNPGVNVGTGSMQRGRWSEIVDGFIEQMSAPLAPGQPLDVRENVKFKGGHMSRWLHATFPDNVGAIAIEIKKTYMDEWTGAIDTAAANRFLASLQAAALRIRSILSPS